MPAPPVHKTFKLFVGGAFPRSESGRTLPLVQQKGKSGQPRVLAQIARASRKDLRAAAEAARGALGKWSSAPAVLRGQILHRMAELLHARRGEFERCLVELCGVAPARAKAEVDGSADRLLWYAGWCDKLSQVLGTVNQVPGPYFNFSMPEPSGVICALPPARPALLGLISVLAPILVPGNTCVLIAEVAAAPVAVTFAEVCATSDLPAGVANILTGTREELLPPAATHREFDGNFLVASDHDEIVQMEGEAADHVKRQLTLPAASTAWWSKPDAQDLRFIAAFCEIKTAWHTMGR
jgi:acyl-CoA reductase-like NAD-dependent aldehyde dehydrogenase